MFYTCFFHTWVAYVISGSKRCFDKRHGTQPHFSLRCYTRVSISVTGLTGAAGFSMRPFPSFFFFIWMKIVHIAFFLSYLVSNVNVCHAGENGSIKGWSSSCSSAAGLAGLASCLGLTPAAESRPTHLHDLRWIQLITHLALVLRFRRSFVGFFSYRTKMGRIQLPSEDPRQLHRASVYVRGGGLNHQSDLLWRPAGFRG